jgi:hypothetical protein
VVNSRLNKYLINDHNNEANGAGIWDPITYDGKQFRRRFRVPYSIVAEIVEEYKLDFPKKRSKKCYDTRILILVALRVLGSVVTFDLIEKLNAVDEETNRVFFHKFTRWGRKQYACPH